MTVDDRARVVVTGLGVASAFGLGRDAFAAGLRSGRSALGPATLFDASGSIARVAGEVAGVAEAHLASDPRHTIVLSRAMKLALLAAGECLERARIGVGDRSGVACLVAINRHEINADDFAAAFERATTASGANPGSYAFDRDRFLARGARAAQPLWLLKFIPNMAAAHVMRAFGLRGESNTYTSESASLQSLGDAADAIRRGRYPAALCGSADSRFSPIGIARYERLGLLAHSEPADVDASRPFDRARRGWVIGEGAAFFLLERLDRALARGAKPLAELVGVGSASDAFHPFAPEPRGRGLAAAMRRALDSPGGVRADAVVAAAAGRADFDDAESVAIHDVFRDVAPRVTAPAGALGRTFVAGGALNAAAAVLAIESGSLGPTANCDAPVASAPSGLLLAGESCVPPPKRVLANAYGIGGSCASALFGTVDS